MHFATAACCVGENYDCAHSQCSGTHCEGRHSRGGTLSNAKCCGCVRRSWSYRCCMTAIRSWCDVKISFACGKARCCVDVRRMTSSTYPQYYSSRPLVQCYNLFRATAAATTWRKHAALPRYSRFKITVGRCSAAGGGACNTAGAVWLPRYCAAPLRRAQFPLTATAARVMNRT